MNLELDVATSVNMPNKLRREIIALCDAAYEEDLEPLFNTFGEATHVLGRTSGHLVSHAMWVTRWLQPGESSPLKTAYVEMVATHPTFQRKGFASRVMERLVLEIPRSYDLAALCPAEPTLYLRLGWRFWRGPLHIRAEDGPLATPVETVMVLELPDKQRLDLSVPLSAEWRKGELW